jgi:hypothetical protein
VGANPIEMLRPRAQFVGLCGPTAVTVFADPHDHPMAESTDVPFRDDYQFLLGEAVRNKESINSSALSKTGAGWLGSRLECMFDFLDALFLMSRTG